MDIGSGTGLSTYFWSDRARAVIGIEPNDDMCAQASRADRKRGANVSFEQGLSTATSLPDGCADIVTCSQSLHWMEPDATFTEIHRILRPDGVFAAYDCDWPPSIEWQVEEVYRRFVDHATALGDQLGLYAGVIKWPKSRHLERMRSSGQFRYVKEVTAHHEETGDGARMIELALSQGSVATLLKNGLSESEIGLKQFREDVHRLMGDRMVPWYWSYRVRIGIR